MFLPKLLTAAALAVALIPVTTAQAAAPWSDPVAVPGSQAGGGPQVLFTRTRGGAVAFNGAGSIPGAPTLRSLLGDAGPQNPTTWSGAPDFDTTFSAWAAGDRIMYVGPSGRRVKIGIAPGPSSTWTTTLRGPDTGGARVAATAVPHAGTAGAFATFEGGGGYVYLVRQLGTHAPSATQRVSDKRASIRSVAVAMNASGDVLTAWDLHGTVQARFWYGSSKRFGPIQNLGKVNAAMHLSVALGNDRRATVAWVDQRVSEGNTGQNATVWATSRSASRGFLLPAKQLEAYPDTTIPGGTVIQAAYTSTGRGIIAWSGRNAVRAALVNGRSIGAPQDLAPIAPTDSLQAIGLGNLVTSSGGAAAVTMIAPVDATNNQILVAPLSNGAAAFGPAEAASAPGPFLADPSAGFDFTTNQLTVAWRVPQSGIALATRPTP
ncbi:hypothetical protein OM076_40630 [Solirubrobacter ginsenosidimutans]|uniref:Uncharacterized protein n=1 Tax=Solirubrobacter ginsenosidimutans TaxID=490573 RepID=A0A9X3N3W8_9ACTN|nr:hypothetical protein [Solirubrobacter ginsenosidimutans]MDA0166638.1 hypothetical protein [Solirubrobacter ginsenosidimutans]